MKKVIFCQISNTLINPKGETETLEDKYFSSLYSSRPGYWKPSTGDFWEVPVWIARASRSIPGAVLHIVKDIQKSIDYLRSQKPDYVLFSCLEVNKKFIKQIIQAVPGEITFVLGGYINQDYFLDTPFYNTVWFDTLQAGIEYMGFKFKPGESYHLFRGMKTIPRLTLSSGCLHRCAFCCVSKKLEVSSPDDITDQIKAFEDLEFELVYLNDKTYGQAENFHVLPLLARFIRSFNPDFKGFIVQTTAAQILKIPEEYLKFSEIRYIEIGVESFNDPILRELHKPHNTDLIKRAMWKIRDVENIKVIPNIMIGLAGIKDGVRWQETESSYRNTLRFLEANEDIVSHVNPYHLALYEGTESSKQLSNGSSEDSNENSKTRTWFLDQSLHDNFYNAILQYGIRQLNKKQRG